MICLKCGRKISDYSETCMYCGADVKAGEKSESSQDMYNQQNNGQQNGQGYQYYQPQQYSQYNQQNPYNPFQQNRQQDKTNIALLILAFFVPAFGVIYCIASCANGRNKSGKNYLIAAVSAVVVNSLLALVFNIMLGQSII